MTDVTRESLAAALERELNQPHPAGPKMYAELADAILASLPSPAPEPPPREDLDVPRVVPDAFPSQQLTDRYGQPVTRFGFHLEGRAAQPAPGLDVEVLMQAILDADSTVDFIDPNKLIDYRILSKTLAAEYIRLLHARSVPEEASEGRSE